MGYCCCCDDGYNPENDIEHQRRQRQLSILQTSEDRAEVLYMMDRGICDVNGAIESLANGYMDGLSRERNVSRALFYYERLMATSVNPQLHRIVGRIYEEGNQVEKDEAKAWQYYLEGYDCHKKYDPPGGDDGTVNAPFFLQTNWNRLGGGVLEQSICSGAIRLIDAAWLIKFYQIEKNTRIPRRQDMPDEAFLSPTQVVLATQGNSDTPVDSIARRLRMVCLSYMWLDKDHPDPFGWTLKLLVEQLKQTIRREIDGEQYGRWAVFWDYPSLFQDPRTEEEDVLFDLGLRGLSALYSHQYTLVYKVTMFPPDYPVGYPVADAAQEVVDHATAPYMQRGWPFTESCWAALTKSGEKTIDISTAAALEASNEEATAEVDESSAFATPTKLLADGIEPEFVDHYYTILLTRICGARSYPLEFMTPLDRAALAEGLYQELSATRKTPLLPSDFDDRVAQCSFTNGKVDLVIVRRLYREAFASQFQRAEALVYRKMNWSDVDIQHLARALASPGAMPLVRNLFLGENFIETDGAHALGQAISRMEAENFHLDLMYCINLRDQGVAALLSPSLSHLYSVSLCGCFIGVEGCEAIKRAFLPTDGDGGDACNLCHLKILEISENPRMGDAGCQVLSSIAYRLEVLEIAHCKIGNEGCMALLDSLLQRGVDVRPEYCLQALNLRGNEFGDACATALVALAEREDPPLHTLDVSETELSSSLGESLAHKRPRFFFRRRYSDARHSDGASDDDDWW